MLKMEELHLKSGEQQNCARTKIGRPYHIRRPSRYRQNVLDMITVVGARAVTAYIFVDVDMSFVESVRKKFDDEGRHLTVTVFVLKAIGIAQEGHPASRTFCLPFGREVTYNNIVAGFTVEREVEGEPIVFFCEIEKPQSKSLLELSEVLRSCAEDDLMKERKLRQQMIFAQFPFLLRRLILMLGLWFPALRLICMGATFGLSSLGALGVRSVCGPSVCTSVFGLGAVEERAILVNGDYTIKPMMTISLSFDQRALDYGQAVLFLSEVKSLLEGRMKERL